MNPELQALAATKSLSFDTETTGLRPFHGDRPFAAVLSDGRLSAYVDLGVVGELSELMTFLSARPRTYYLHNAKFDLHHMHTLGLHFHERSELHDTMVLSRLVHSDLSGGYSLDNCAKYFLNESKLDIAKAYVLEHELYDYADVPGLARRVRLDHYDKIPREVIEPYARQDALLTYRLAARLFELLVERSLTVLKCSTTLAYNESRLVKTCCKMEAQGVRVDLNYVKEAMNYEQERFETGAQGFYKETGRSYVASTKNFTEAFGGVGVDTESLTKTDKGNTRFDSKALSKIDHPAASFALDVKDAKARLNFYAGFAYEADLQGYLHTNYRQAGTKSGRFASASPNVQNLTRSDDAGGGGELERYPVRRAIVPHSEDYCLVMLDFAQQEFRMMLDYAGQMDLIEEIKAGKDVHTATAQLVGVERFKAKTLNFALLYGAGPAKIAEMLGLSVEEATAMVEKFFAALPQVKKLIADVRAVAKYRGYVINWYGRMINYPDRGLSYAAPNHLIQGGAADVIRVAMNRCDELLAKTRSHLSLTIHDELVFNVHRSELNLIPEFQLAMESVYPYQHLPLPVDVSHSWVSLADKVKGLPL